MKRRDFVRTAAGLLIALCAVSAAAPITIIGAPTKLQVSGGGGEAPDPGDLYELPEDRTTLWRPGVTYNGGIPARSTVCATINASTYGNGASNATSGIQSALNSCPSGQTVVLSAGTFRISSTPLFIPSNVTLRGAGPDQTTLTKPTGTNEAAVVLGRRWIDPEGSTNLSADAVKGAYAVTVSSTSGLSVGELVLIDATTDPEISRWADDCDSGCQTWFSRANRPLTQMMEIASIVGTTITFTTPFHASYTTTRTAQLTRFPQTAIEWAGIEDVKVVNGEGGDGGGNVYFEFCKYCWARNIESEGSIGGSVRFYRTLRSEVRDSYVHSTRDPNPGGAGYGIDISTAASDNLVENNISWNFNKTLIMRASGGGNVVAYNYFDDGRGEGYPTIPEVGLNAAHMTTPHHELLEGNLSWHMGSDSRWGNSVYITFFRNHVTGLRRNAVGGLSDTTNRRAASVTAEHWWYSFVGNVLGYSGQTATGYSGFEYQDSYPYGDSLIPMWRFGEPDSVGTPHITTYDSSVEPTTLRDGNFDYVTNEVRWHGIGGSASTTPPANSTIPDSLYLTEKPAFFEDLPWPWVTPEGGTKVHTLPAKVRFEAMQ